MTGRWIDRPQPPHHCNRPRPEEFYGVDYLTKDWQCECGKVYRWTKRYDQREGDYSGWEKVRDA